MENPEGQDREGEKQEQKETPTIPHIPPHLVARANPPRRRRKGTRINWTISGVTAGIVIAITTFVLALHHSAPLQLSNVVKPQDIPEKGRMDLWTLKKYALSYAPLRAITQTSLVEDKLTIYYKRDWFAFGAMGILCPILLLVVLGMGGSLIQDRKIRRRGGLP